MLFRSCTCCTCFWDTVSFRLFHASEIGLFAFFFCCSVGSSTVVFPTATVRRLSVRFFVSVFFSAVPAAGVFTTVLPTARFPVEAAEACEVVPAGFFFFSSSGANRLLMNLRIPMLFSAFLVFVYYRPSSIRCKSRFVWFARYSASLVTVPGATPSTAAIWLSA